MAAKVCDDQWGRMAIAALSGKREDISKVLAEHVDKIHRAATGN